MKILLFGSKGYMGEKFLELYPEAICPSVDIADQPAVAAALDEHQPDVVINAAGKTGRPNVDWCEDHKEETVRSNITGPLILLDECQKRGIYWVHMSSGCIYQGDKGGEGFTEDDAPNFFGSFYSRTKAWSDQILSEFPARPDGTGGVLILRIRMPFDDSDNPRSLISKLIRYERVLDVPNSLTYLPDFLDASAKLIEGRKTGIYNIVNPGAMSPYQVVDMYKKLVQPEHAFEALSLDDLGEVTKAARSNCILSTKKLEGEGIAMRPVEEVVEKAMKKRKEKK